jgi:hypothetical protein
VLGRVKGLRPRFARRVLLQHAPSTRPARGGRAGVSPTWASQPEVHMSLEIYTVVLELVRRLSPRLSQFKARSASLGDQF